MILTEGFGTLSKLIDSDVVARPVGALREAAQMSENRVKGIVAVGAVSSSLGAAVEVEVGRRVHVDRILLVEPVTEAGGRVVGATGDAAVTIAQ